jgi:hypothetical protein
MAMTETDEPTTAGGDGSAPAIIRTVDLIKREAAGPSIACEWS